MSQYYRPKRSRNLYAPNSNEPFKLSRSKVELFIDCPRCFYVDRRLGVGRPPGFPFNLNSAVDELLKREFDQYRNRGEPHPLITRNGIDAIPHHVDQLNDWRHNFTGVRYHHDATNLLIFGAIDDLWINSSEELIVVDYKATSKKEPILQLNDTWHRSYKRQMEIYQWLLARNGYSVSSTGYFVYCNGQAERDSFKSTLHFDINVIPYDGSHDWVEATIMDLFHCLESDAIPESGNDCDYCGYRTAAADVIQSG